MTETVAQPDEVEKKVLASPVTSVTSEEYVASNFLRQEGEVRRDIRDVGTNCWRINFWSYKQVEGCFTRDMFISRSLYVVTKKQKDGSWTHIIKDSG